MKSRRRTPSVPSTMILLQMDDRRDGSAAQRKPGRMEWAPPSSNSISSGASPTASSGRACPVFSSFRCERMDSGLRASSPSPPPEQQPPSGLAAYAGTGKDLGRASESREESPVGTPEFLHKRRRQLGPGSTWDWTRASPTAGSRSPPWQTGEDG